MLDQDYLATVRRSRLSRANSRCDPSSWDARSLLPASLRSCPCQFSSPVCAAGCAFFLAFSGANSEELDSTEAPRSCQAMALLKASNGAAACDSITVQIIQLSCIINGKAGSSPREQVLCARSPLQSQMALGDL